MIWFTNVSGFFRRRVPRPQTLDSLVQSAIRDALRAESLTDHVKKAADKAVREAVDGAFGYNSEFAKGLKETVKQVLPTTSADDLAEFSHAVRELIRRRLTNLASDTAKTHLDEVLSKILPDDPVITLDDLKVAYKKKLQEQISRNDLCHCEEVDEEYLDFTWHVDTGNDSDVLTSRYWDLWMSPEPGASRYGGKDVITLRFKSPFDQKDSDLFECWDASVGSNEKLIGSLFTGPLYGFDAMVFRLRTGTAKLKAAV